MRLEGVVPNAYSYNVAITACKKESEWAKLSELQLEIGMAALRDELALIRSKAVEASETLAEDMTGC